MEKDNCNIPNKDEEQLNESDEQNFINFNPHNSQDTAITRDGSDEMGFQSSYYGLDHSVRENKESIVSLFKEAFEENLPALISPEDYDSLVRKNLDMMVDVDILKDQIEKKEEQLREIAESIKIIEDYNTLTEGNHLQIDDNLKNCTLIKEKEKCDFMIKDSFSKVQFISSDSQKNQIINLKMEEMKPEIEPDFITKRDITIKDLEQEELLEKVKSQITNQDEILYIKSRDMDSLKKAFDSLKSKNAELEYIITNQKQSLNIYDTVKIQEDLVNCRFGMTGMMCEFNELGKKWNTQSTVQLSEESNKIGLGNTNEENEKLIQINIYTHSKIEFFKNQFEQRNSVIKAYRIETMEACEYPAIIKKILEDYHNSSHPLIKILEELVELWSSLIKTNISITSNLEQQLKIVVISTLDISLNLIAKLQMRCLLFHETFSTQLCNINEFLDSSNNKTVFDYSKDQSLCGKGIETSLTNHKDLFTNVNSTQLLSNQNSHLISENNDSLNIKQIFENKLKCYDKINKQKDNLKLILDNQLKSVEFDNCLKHNKTLLLRKVELIEYIFKITSIIDSILDKDITNIEKEHVIELEEIQEQINITEKLEKEENKSSIIIEKYKEKIEATIKEQNSLLQKYKEISNLMKENAKYNEVGTNQQESVVLDLPDLTIEENCQPNDEISCMEVDQKLEFDHGC